MKLFGSSGIRAVFDKDLLTTAFRAGGAAGRYYHNIAVGTDTRTSRDAMKYALISGLLSSGAECCDAGIIPTPTLAYLTREYDAGIMITASHNPPEYNGLKFLNPDGSSFDARQQEKMEKVILGDSFKTAPWKDIKQCGVNETAIERHIDCIMKHFPEKLKIKAVVDAGGGAASEVTPRLLERLGCEVITLNCKISGFFPRVIEPAEANLPDLCRIVKESGADIGIAHDGDADRMMAVDEQGRFISGDALLAVFARELKSKNIVTTFDASMAIEEMDINVRRTRVGDTWVSEELKHGGDFGGETSGAWVFPEISLCPDGIFAAAQIAAIASRQKLSALVDAVPVYPLQRGSVGSGGVVMSSLGSNLRALSPDSISNTDGFRLSFKNGWLLVRPSGTEPKIRLTAEARSRAGVKRLYESGLKAVRDSIVSEGK